MFRALPKNREALIEVCVTDRFGNVYKVKLQTMMKTNVNIGYLVFLSFVAALGGFLFGYDTAVISGTIAR